MWKPFSGLGWAGIKNGELLRPATGEFDVLLTMDRSLKDQPPFAEQRFGVVLIRAVSNRVADLIPLVPAILAAIEGISPGELRRVGG